MERAGFRDKQLSAFKALGLNLAHDRRNMALNSTWRIHRSKFIQRHGSARALQTTSRHLLDGGLFNFLLFNNLVEAGGVEPARGIENRQLVDLTIAYVAPIAAVSAYGVTICHDLNVLSIVRSKARIYLSRVEANS